ncbi:MAG: hypothetical protein AB7F89_25960 [Pirellulaceae bacterium]
MSVFSHSATWLVIICLNQVPLAETPPAPPSGSAPANPVGADRSRRESPAALALAATESHAVGQIVWLNVHTGRLWISLDSTRGLPPGARVNIYAKPAAGATASERVLKGQVEVVAILDRNLADAQVISRVEREDQPVPVFAVGDLAICVAPRPSAASGSRAAAAVPREAAGYGAPGAGAAARTRDAAFRSVPPNYGPLLGRPFLPLRGSRWSYRSEHER